MRQLLPALLLLAAGCASEERIQSQWDAWVDEHSACATVDDCAIVYPGCPLGCYEAVSAEAADEAEATADRLIRRYERGGRACDYDCAEAPPLVCEADTCGFAE